MTNQNISSNNNPRIAASPAAPPLPYLFRRRPNKSDFNSAFSNLLSALRQAPFCRLCSILPAFILPLLLFVFFDARIECPQSMPNFFLPSPNGNAPFGEGPGVGFGKIFVPSFVPQKRIPPFHFVFYVFRFTLPIPRTYRSPLLVITHK